MRRGWVAGLALLALLPFAPAARASTVPLRVHLPAGYGSGGSYPLVLVLNAVFTECRPDCTPVESMLDRLPAVVVYEDRPTSLADYVDWRDGSQLNERAWVAAIAAVDRRYRTSHRRQDRTVIGISAGGYGAVVLGAHHPSLFGQVASFSGPLDIRGAHDALEPAFVVTSVPPPPSPAVSPSAVFGTPVLDDAGWKAANPTDLVSHLRGTGVYHVAGNGLPCRTTDNPVSIEPLVRTTNDSFATAARQAGVRDTYVRRPCGVHGYGEFVPEVQQWLGQLHLTAR